ncbi:transporter [Pelagibius sp.]|uniref:transporter n=1 Tax=Pelagibius sp. TaxID=1931238 RepID=UPI003B504DE8
MATLAVPETLPEDPGFRLPLPERFAAVKLAALEPKDETPSRPDWMVEELHRRLEERHALVYDLEQRLNEKDAAVRALESRVEQLERLVRSLPRLAADGPPGIEPGATTRARSTDVAASQEAATELPGSGPETAPTGREASPPAPGEVAVDPEAAERALERTLVLTGDLLLPVGKADIEPFVSYEFDDTSDLPANVLIDSGGSLIATNRRVERDVISTGLNLRAGLPYDSQVEISLPYKFVRRQENQDLSSQTSSDNSGNGIGDLRLGVATTLLRENGWFPDVVGRVTWDSDTGKDSDNGVSLNSGFHEIIGSLSAIKRQDPFAFVARLSYEHAFENDDVQPGDRFGVGAAAILAASPETSLRVSFSASYRDDLEFNGNTIDGTDENQAILSLGISSILARGTLLNFSAGAGLTDDSPDYTVFLSLPVRLTLW